MTTEVFVQSGDVRIHCRASGQGPLLILVHGFPDNAETFESLVPELSKTYTVVRPSLRGWPPSDIPQNEEAYDLSNTVGDLIAVLQHFKSPRAIFGGHDFGGAAVGLLALFKPELVAGLLLINAPILPNFSPLVHLDKDQQKLSEYTIKFAAYREGDDKDVENKTSHIPDQARRAEIQRYLNESSIQGMMWLYKRNYPQPPYGNPQDTSGWKYQVPTLIVWGTADPYFDNKIINNLPSIFLAPTRLSLISGASHWPWHDQPARVLSEITSWLQTLEK